MTDLYAKKRLPVWPDKDPVPLWFNTAPPPSYAPAMAAPALRLKNRGEAAGWPIRTGYSRAWRRGQKVGHFRLIEAYGVWAGDHPSKWRFLAIHERFVDAKAEHAYFADTDELELITSGSGGPGTWTWSNVVIFRAFARHHVLITDLGNFLDVRGSVTPGWFKEIEERDERKKQRQKLAAKGRSGRKEQGG